MTFYIGFWIDNTNASPEMPMAGRRFIAVRGSLQTDVKLYRMLDPLFKQKQFYLVTNSPSATAENWPTDRILKVSFGISLPRATQAGDRQPSKSQFDFAIMSGGKILASLSGMHDWYSIELTERLGYTGGIQLLSPQTIVDGGRTAEQMARLILTPNASDD